MFNKELKQQVADLEDKVNILEAWVETLNETIYINSHMQLEDTQSFSVVEVLEDYFKERGLYLKEVNGKVKVVNKK